MQTAVRCRDLQRDGVSSNRCFVWRALGHHIFEAKAPVVREFLAAAGLASVVEQAHGCIAGLRALKGRCTVTVYTDSQYLANAMTRGWAKRWRANGWKRNRTDRALNPDLWQELLDLCDRHAVTFSWVRGHAGTAENERCDRLSREAASKPDLPPDSGYETTLASPRGRT